MNRKPKTVTVATRITADERTALEWLAAHKGLTLSAILDRYGTVQGVELSRELQAAKGAA